MSITTTRLAPIALAAALPLLASCQKPSEPAAPEAPAPATPTVVLDSTLNRAALLAALTEARTATADGRPRDAALSGRTVSVRLPFGCDGAGSTEQAQPGLPTLARGDDGSLMLRVLPEDLAASDLVVTPGADGAATPSPWEAVEGFWIARPWSGLDACRPGEPAPMTVHTAEETEAEGGLKVGDIASPAETERTSGLAAVFETGGSRLGRRQGQAYVHVIRGDKGGRCAPPALGKVVSKRSKSD